MFDDSLVTVWSAPNYCYRSASFLYRVSSYSLDFQMWQHRFNSAVFRRGQPHTETLWGGSGRKEGDPRETGLNSFRLEFLTLFLLSRWLLTSFEGGGDELNSEGGIIRVKFNLTSAMMWCVHTEILWQWYTQAWKISIHDSWKDVQGQYLRFWSESSCSLWWSSGV